MKLKNIILLLTVLFAFNACSDDTSPVLIMPDTPNTLDQLSSSVIEMTDADLEKEVLTLKWTAQKIEMDVVQQYVIQFDVAGNNFANAKNLAQTAALTYSIKGSELNDFLIKSLAHPEFTAVRYDVRVVSAAVGKDNEAKIYEQTASNVQTVLVTTTSSAPETLYMIGTDFGDWQWTAAAVAEMIPVNDKAGEFWCVRYFNAGNGFKWSTKKAWGTDFAELNEKVGYTTADGNAVLATSGMYIVYINYPKGIVTIEPAAVYGFGDCFGGWVTPQPLTVSGKTMTITTVAAGDLRLYAKSTAAVSVGGDWWRMEFILRNGAIEYRANGGDQERVNVAAGKTVTLDFNAGTGTIK